MEPSILTRYLIYQLYHARVLLYSIHYSAKEEDIHQFRVTLRGIRSLAKLFFDTSFPFPKTLKHAMQESNPIRELDVLLGSLSRSKYPKLFNYLLKLRKNSSNALFTQKYTDKTLLLIDEYSFLISDGNPDFLSEVLIQKVLTHYQHCLDSFLALNDDASPKSLHKLRIQFKDARYGFEFLGISGIHQYPEVIEHCKEVQTLLGAIQDKVNQIDVLKKLYKEFPSSEIKELISKEKKKLRRLKETIRSELSHNGEDNRLSG